MRTHVTCVTLALALAVAAVSASGPIGIYGIVERVVFEPATGAPERVQVWGAFAYVDELVNQTSAVRRGYLYFQLPPPWPGASGATHLETIRREWADLRRVAGTGQAVGFGQWHYIGRFADLAPDATGAPLYMPAGGARIDLRVRPASETPSNPVTYQTNVGVVKLADTGSHAAIVQRLREALKR
jgi:hypothetical protein